MENQIILACDDNGNFLEYIPRIVGHTGQGKRHRAITVLLYNNKGQVLLQLRKHLVFDKVWDFTGSTHPLHLEDGKDETYEEATLRCLEVEYRIKDVQVKNLGEFIYFAAYKNNLCENEYCAMLVGEYNGVFDLNPEVGYEFKWMDKTEFLKDIEANPDSYAPWPKVGIKLLKEKGFFELK